MNLKFIFMSTIHESRACHETLLGPFDPKEAQPSMKLLVIPRPIIAG
jgi:hypothetical protein